MLQVLPRNRLADLTDRFELDVSDRRKPDAHIDAIVRKRSLDFAELLGCARPCKTSAFRDRAHQRSARR